MPPDARRAGLAILRDLYRQIGPRDPVTLAWDGYWWVMDLAAYKRIREACRAAGAIYPEGDDPDDWEPREEDRLFGLRIDIRDGEPEPRLERSHD
jgi:hypothetical protein